MPFGDDGFAEQGGDRHVMDAAERPEPKGQSRQQAVDEGQRKLARMHGRHDRQRQQLAEQPDDDEGKRGACREPDHRADAG
jgi:hypothetical protein